jgi:pimeloyl-ACP methyl ester carboxylesterase
LDDSKLHITRWGDAGPRVVMVHGSAQGSRTGGDAHFSNQAHLAERGWRVVLPDRPGHGRTPAPGRGDDAEADGALIAELLEDGDHLVGHSFGGAVALAAAARRPTAVCSLTVIEPAMLALAIGNGDVRKLVAGLVMANLFSLSPESRMRRAFKLLNIPPDIRGGSAPEEIKRMSEGLRRLKIPTKRTIEAELATIKAEAIPFLVITGGWSPAFEATGDAVAAAGNGQRVVIPSPHHLPQLVSDEFNQVLAAFMQEADGFRSRFGSMSMSR